MTPWQRYQQDLRRPDMQADEAQAATMAALQSLYEAVMARRQRIRAQQQRPKMLRWLQRDEAPAAPAGLYLWGGVGRGKTYLVDTFYDCLPGDRQLRLHFHHFMQQIHAELDTLKGQVDPLLVVADRLAEQLDLLCLDEFFVADITDAMLLGTLLQALFERGVTLVTTSNCAPDDLYRNGLQRARFLPAIASLKQHCQVLNVDGGQDFRLRTLEQADLFCFGSQAGGALQQSFTRLAGAHSVDTARQLSINGRTLPFIKRAGDLIWFDFATLCQGPRSQNDYIELARSYHTLILSDIPSLAEENNDAARRLITLIDELYDRRVKLLASFAAPLAELYSGRQLAFEFQRTHSRLVEMQSHHYLAEPHRP